MTGDLAAFIAARLDEDERELQKDPPVGLGYADLSVRTRREIAAHRAILARHRPAFDPADHDYAGIPCAEDEYLWPCTNLFLLATIWSDHPDYRKEWKP